MRVLHDTSERAFPDRRSVVTIGAYDGIHLGHRMVIAQVRDLAAHRGSTSVVVTFDRHPATVVRPESAPRLITDLPQKLELLAGTGVDATVVITFDEARSRESGAEFVREVLVDCLAAELVVIGEDFHFGHGRSGNVALLRTMGAELGFEVEPIALAARPDGVVEPISSTAIRRALAGGQVETATALLGRHFELRGTVVTGDQRGRLLGFPTANVEVPNQMCIPADGVYAGWYERPDGTIHACAVNVGRRPTFYEHADHSLVEAHVLDFADDLYGETAKIRFVAFLRSERKFDGVDALVAQLKRDVEATRVALELD